MSLRTRLLVAVGIVALMALVVAGAATYSLLQSFLISQVNQTLNADTVPLERVLASGQPVSLQTVAQVAPGAFVELRGTGGQVLGVVPAIGQGGPLPQPVIPSNVAGTAASAAQAGSPLFVTTGSTQPGGPHFQMRVVILPGGDALIAALPLDVTTAILGRLAVIELVVALAALALAMVLGWSLVRAGLRPLADVERTAGAIAAGELDRRVPTTRRKTEVGRLAVAFNAMLDRIQDAFAQREQTERALRASEERLRRFVADASHELRTPLAAVSAYAELFERGADRRPEDLARAMTGIRAETARMGGLVEDLLLLARLDEGRPLHAGQVELVALVAEAVHAARAVGPQWPVHLRALQPVEVIGDSSRLRQVIDNLLANVRAHTPEGTTAVVRVGEDEGQAYVEVCDDGPGFSSEQASRVFERFYRIESSRSRRQGGPGAGAGLGLAIVASIVQAHGGVVAAAPSPSGGACFSFRLPVSAHQALLGSARTAI